MKNIREDIKKFVNSELEPNIEYEHEHIIGYISHMRDLGFMNVVIRFFRERGWQKI